MSIPEESFLILVVEDNRVSRQIMCRFLMKEGYRVIEAANGEEGLTQYEEKLPDLVLLDAMMPIMDGFECCTRLLELPGTEELPIIMVTGLDDQESVDLAFDAGATDYVTKPIHWPILRRRVKNMAEKGYLYRELERVNQQLQTQAITDALTKVANRRHFDECLHREWSRSVRSRSELSLILCDVDYFKPYNDTYGHQAGDVCLQKVADALKTKAARRATDIVARYGGEEFAAILPGTGLDGAIEVAERLRYGVSELAIPHQGAKGDARHVTISVGVASVIAKRDISPVDLLNWVDKALYHAKKSGRNKLAIYQDGQMFTASGDASSIDASSIETERISLPTSPAKFMID